MCPALGHQKSKPKLKPSKGDGPRGQVPLDSSWRSKLALGVVLAIVTAGLGEAAWRSHEHSTRRKEEIARLSGTQDDLIRAVGGLTTAATVLVRAHEQRFPTNDVNSAIEEYNRLQSQWDESFDVLQVKMSREFKSPQVLESWQVLLGELGDLDTDTAALEKFEAKDSSAGHARQIAKCNNQIKVVEESLRALNRRLDAYIDSRRYAD